MKRILSILLVPVFILTATVGVTLTSYSCKGMKEKAMAKPCCKDVGKGGCCEKDALVLKIQDAFIKASFHSNPAASLYLIAEHTFCLDFVPASLAAHSGKGHWEHAPPVPDVGLYILHRALII